MLVGCNQQDESGVVLARVNSFSLTENEAKLKVSTSLSLIQKFYPKAIEKESDYVKTRNGIANLVPHSWVTSILLREEAKRLDISVSDKDLAETRQAYMDGHHFAGSYDEFVTFTKVDRAMFDYDIETETLKKKVILHEYPDLRGFSDQQVAEVRQRYIAFNRTAIATNEAQLAVASNVYQKIVAGLDFQRAGKEYGELFPGQEKVWRTLTPADFADQVLKDWAFSAKVGDVSAPLDLEDGISIVKVLKKKDGVMSETPLALDVAEVKLARITFKANLVMKVPDDAELRSKMLEARTKESEAELFGKLKATAKIEYPQGEDFVRILYSDQEGGKQ